MKTVAANNVKKTLENINKIIKKKLRKRKANQKYKTFTKMKVILIFQVNKKIMIFLNHLISEETLS